MTYRGTDRSSQGVLRDFTKWVVFGRSQFVPRLADLLGRIRAPLARQCFRRVDSPVEHMWTPRETHIHSLVDKLGITVTVVSFLASHLQKQPIAFVGKYFSKADHGVNSRDTPAGTALAQTHQCRDSSMPQITYLLPMPTSQPDYRIAVVCLGNICRSPIAEKVLTARLRANGLGDLAIVESAGTAGWHAGEPADPRAEQALARAGYPFTHQARQFQQADFDTFDLILGMDYSNVRDLRGLAPDEEAATNVRIFRSFDAYLMHLPEDDPALETPDPYYGTATDFDEVIAMVESAADGIIDHVRLELPLRR